MKSYLNRAEKVQALTIAAFSIYMENRSCEWERLKRDKETIKYLRMAKSFASRALNLFLRGIDEQEVSKLLESIKKMDVAVKYKDEAIRDYNRMLALDSVTPVNTDDFIEICSQAVEQCQGCTKENQNKCRLKSLLIKYEIPVCNEEPNQGECPYLAERVK